jgi:hypothetical protein
LAQLLLQSATSELIDLGYPNLLRRTDMTIAIEDISRTEQLDREELSCVRGGIALIPVDSPPGDGSMPPFPTFPSGFPQPVWIDLKNPTAQ